MMHNSLDNLWNRSTQTFFFYFVKSSISLGTRFEDRNSFLEVVMLVYIQQQQQLNLYPVSFTFLLRQLSIYWVRHSKWVIGAIYVCLTGSDSCFVGKGTIDKANEEVRNIILRIWPKTSMELLDKVVQDPEGRKGEGRSIIMLQCCDHVQYTARDIFSPYFWTNAEVHRAEAKRQKSRKEQAILDPPLVWKGYVAGNF